jgi:hypothetical protein
MSSAHRIAALAWLAAVACVATGCGGSGATSPGPAPSSTAQRAAANATASQALAGRRLSSHAQYAAFARAVNLQAADLPGFTAKAKKRDHSEDSRFRSCAKDLKEAKSLFKATSMEFSKQGGLHFQSLSSEVEIARTAARARYELAAVKRIIGAPATRRCLARVFEAAFGKYTGARRVGDVTVRTAIENTRIVPLALGSAVAGTDGGFGVSVAMDVTYTVSGPLRSATVPTSLDIDVLAFLVGRGEVTFLAATLGKASSSDLETQLFARLVSRAVAAGRSFPAVGEPAGPAATRPAAGLSS